MRIQIKTFAATAIILLLAVSSFAQPKQNNDNKGEKCNWKERMYAEKVEFIKNALELTPKETEAFWPVYNAISKEKESNMSNIHKKYFALKHAVSPSQHKEGKAGNDADSKTSDKSENRKTTDINALLNEYAAALAANSTNEEKWLKMYLEVLPAEKVAKLYVAEEAFRRQQIGKLGGGPGHGKPDGNKSGDARRH